MQYSLIIDDDAASVAPELTKGQAGVELDDNELRVDAGELFHLQVPRTAIRAAVLLPDPRPLVYLPPGVSEAVEQFGRDVLCVVGSYEGLLRIDFAETVEAGMRPADLSGNPADSTPHPVTFQHLILSLEDAEGFVNTLQGGARGARPETRG